jgi:hypothetical protein
MSQFLKTVGIIETKKSSGAYPKDTSEAQASSIWTHYYLDSSLPVNDRLFENILLFARDRPCAMLA